jgi:hypothetical protein
MNRHKSAYEEKLLNSERAKLISCFTRNIFYYTLYNNSTNERNFYSTQKLLIYIKKKRRRKITDVYSAIFPSWSFNICAREWKELPFSFLSSAIVLLPRERFHGVKTGKCLNSEKSLIVLKHAITITLTLLLARTRKSLNIALPFSLVRYLFTLWRIFSIFIPSSWFFAIYLENKQNFHVINTQTWFLVLIEFLV